MLEGLLMILFLLQCLVCCVLIGILLRFVNFYLSEPGESAPESQGDPGEEKMRGEGYEENEVL